LSFLAEGFLLTGYRILKVLGSGGFGVTYLARDEQLDRLCAIKEYFPTGLCSREGATLRANALSADDFAWGKASFVKEAQTVAKFNHPNIVKVWRIFDANDTSYMVQAYQSGRDLKQWAAGLDSPPVQAELDQLIIPLFDALSVVHRSEVLHRDISPGNIYIRDDGTPVLLDFGSARHAVAQHTETLSAMVKSGFSPIEQYSTKGKAQGPWSDIYAFAATIYALVTGAPPEEATERLLEDGYVPAKQATKGQYRETFLAAIDWGLRFSPEQRPQSLEEWRGALLEDAAVPDSIDRPRTRPWESSGPSSPSPDPPGQGSRHEPPPSPGPGKILALVLSGLVVLIAGIFIFIINQQGNNTAHVQQPTKAADAAKTQDASKDLQAWHSTPFDDLDKLKAFVKNFPQSQYRMTAENQIAALEKQATRKEESRKELQAWQNASYDDAGALRTFVRNFPNSQYRTVAEDRIKELEKVAITPTDPPAVRFTLTNNAGSTIRVALYNSANKTQVDPAVGRSYILSENETRNYQMACTPGTNICYGASVEGNGLSPYWGTGRGGLQACTQCCLTCGSGTRQMSDTLTMATSSTPPPTITWKVIDQTNTRLSIAYYSGTRYQHGWPDWNRNWSLESRETTHSLSCIAGEKICYGAWETANPYGGRYWGVGPLNKFSCTNCCGTCDGGTLSISLSN
jgi:serine/threonine protein kinase